MGLRRKERNAWARASAGSQRSHHGAKQTSWDWALRTINFAGIQESTPTDASTNNPWRPQGAQAENRYVSKPSDFLLDGRLYVFCGIAVSPTTPDHPFADPPMSVVKAKGGIKPNDLFMNMNHLARWGLHVLSCSGIAFS